MQEDQPKGGSQPPPGQQRGTLDPEIDRPMDPRPLGGSETPHKHPYPIKSMDPRPLGAGKSVPEENEAEEEQESDKNTAAKGPLHDEVDVSPEEQFTRHHVELDPDKLHHYHKEGTLEQVKKKATDVVRAARAAVEHHLPSSFIDNTEDAAPNNIPTPQSNITLHNLKFNSHPEPMHMAKVAEGRNAVIDDDSSSNRKLGMSPTTAAVESGGSSAVGSGAGGASNGDDDFPETLQDAIKDATRISEKERKKDNEKDADQLGEDVNEPEPFGVTSSARSKL